MQTNIVKKIITGLFATITCFTAISFTAKNNFYANAEDGRNIADGVYYIRNLNSNKYMDVSWSKTENGTEVIQFGFNGGLNQQFKITRESDGYYTIKPMHCLSSAIDMRDRTAANTNGTDAQLYRYGSGWDEQRFSIDKASGGGFKIGTKCSGGQKVLEVTNSSKDNNAIVQIWENSDSRINDNWVFEKVAIRKMSYFTLANLSTSDQNDANSIVSSFSNFGFQASQYKNPTKDTISTNSSSDILVFHGHGNTGFFAVSDKKSGATSLRVYSENAPTSSKNFNLSDVIPDENWKNVSIVYFASCYSANSDSSHKSLVQAAYDRGATCAIGFKNTVTGSEDFLRYMMQAAEGNPDLTIQQAITRARISFMNEKSRNDYNPYTADDSPANLNNLVVKGNTSLTFRDFV